MSGASASASAMAAAVAGRDPAALGRLLTDDARLRALLPGGLIEAQGRADVAACLPAIVADFDAVEVVAAAGEEVGDRLLVHYRLDVRRGASHWVCTQTAVCTVTEAGIARIDLLCSGFRRAVAAA